MFEGWASDLLAEYLGHFLDLQPEQLRIRLFSAWRTGLTLENVALRSDALDHLSLPLRLQSGHIGRIVAQVPWRALRSPVILELEDVHLCFCMLTPEDSSPQAASHRAWMAKQAAIVAGELQAMAMGPVGGNESPDAAAQPSQGGVLWTLAQRALGLLLRRLQFAVKRVHVSFADPTTGRCFGVRLGHIHTCTPGEMAASSTLFADDAGILDHAAAAARGAIQKEVAIEQFSVYWRVPREANDGHIGALDALSQDYEYGESVVGSAWDVLGDTNIALHVSVQAGGGGTTSGITSSPARVHLAASITAVPLQLRASQVSDIATCADALHWMTVRTTYAHLRPDEPRQRDMHGGASGDASHARMMWKYAINAILWKLKGHRATVPWRPAEQLRHARRRYVLLYRKKLLIEREKKPSAQLSATVKHRRTASTNNVEAPIGTSTGILTTIGEQKLIELEEQLSVSDIVTCRVAARQSLEATTTSAATLTHDAGETGTAWRALSWGVGQAAGVLGYIPGLRGNAATLPQLTVAELQEMLEEMRSQSEEVSKSLGPGVFGEEHASASAAEAGGGAGLVVTLNCLFSSIRMELRQDVDCTSDSYQTIASLEFDGLRSELRRDTDGTSANVTLAFVGGRDCLTHGPGVSATLLESGAYAEEESCAAAADGGAKPSSRGPSPVLRLHYTTTRVPTSNGVASTPTLDFLVHPIRMYAAPACCAALSAFVPPRAPDSFAARCMAATNRLSDGARAAMKAQQLQSIGPSIDVVGKVMNLEMVFPEGNHCGRRKKESDERNGDDKDNGRGFGHARVEQNGSVDDDHVLVLRTGAIVVQRKGDGDGAEEYAEVFGVLNSLATKRDNHRWADHSATVAAAVHAVEERLMYQSMELKLEGLQVLRVAQGQLRHGAVSVDDVVLQPVSLHANLQMHRLADDLRFRQLHCSLHVGSIALALSPSVLETAAKVLTPSPSPPTTARSPLKAQHQEQGNARLRGPGPAMNVIDVGFDGIEVSFSSQLAKKTSEDQRHNLLLQLRSGNLTLCTHVAGQTACKVNLSGISLQDLGAHSSSLPPPVCTSTEYFFPRLAKQLTVEAFHISVEPADKDAFCQTLSIKLVDIVLQGYDGESGNFIRRTHEHQSMHIDITANLFPLHLQLATSLTNVALGQSTILRMVAYAQRLQQRSVAASKEGHTSGAQPVDDDGGTIEPAASLEDRDSNLPGGGLRVDVELHDCCVAWKYQEIMATSCAIPAHLKDFLLVHEDIAVLNVPHFVFRWPLLPEKSQVDVFGEKKESHGPQNPSTSASSHVVGDARSSVPSASGNGDAKTFEPSQQRSYDPDEDGTTLILAEAISVQLATTGLALHPSLPVALLPRLELQRDGDSARLHLKVDAIEAGLHPSHILMASALQQLWQQEMSHLTQDALEPCSDVASEVTSNSGGRENVLVPSGHGVYAPPSPLQQRQSASSTGTPETCNFDRSQESKQANHTPAMQHCPWSLEASIALIGISILGSTPSSACMKLEWQRIKASFTNRTAQAESAAATTGTMSGSLSWTTLTLSVLQPRAVADHLEPTPFGFDRALGNHTDGSRMLGSPRGSFATAPPPSFRGYPTHGNMFTRNLSAEALGLADAAEESINDEFASAVWDITSASPLASFGTPRFSGSAAAVSRYFSAIESEFEDAFSELVVPEGGIRSPREKRSPRKPPIPLNVTSPDFDVALLLSFSHHLASGPSSSAVNGVTIGAAAITLGLIDGTFYSISAASLCLRTYLYGWKSAAECIATYTAFVDRVRRNMHAHTTSSVVEPTTPPRHDYSLDFLRPATPPAQPNATASDENLPDATSTTSSMRFAVNVDALYVEAVAMLARQRHDPPPLNEENSEVAVIQAVVHGSFESCSTYDSFHAHARIPGLLLSVGTKHASECYASIFLGLDNAAFGVHDMEMVYYDGQRHDEAQEDTSSHSEFLRLARDPNKMTALDIAVSQISTWLVPQTLRVVATLPQHIEHLAADVSALQALSRPEGDHVFYPASFTASKATSFSNPLSLSVKCCRMAALLVADGTLAGYTAPLFEFAASELDAHAVTNNRGELTASAHVSLQLDVFNPNKVAWESMMEPWEMDLQVAAPLRKESAHQPSSLNHKRLNVECKQGLELTLSPAAIVAAESAALIGKTVISRAQARDASLDLQGNAIASLQYGTGHRVCNLTGTAIEVWLASPGPAGAPTRTPTGPADLTLDPFMSANLQIVEWDWRQTRARHTGSPSKHLGVVFKDNEADTVSRQTDFWGGTSFVSGTEAASVAPSSRHSLLYFRLTSLSSPIVGPVRLDTPSTHVHSLASHPTSGIDAGATASRSFARPCRVVSVAEDRSAGATLVTLHSGVCVQNDACVDLEISLRSPLGTAIDHGRDSMVVGHGQRAWLPAASIAAGMLSFRPVATYRSSSDRVRPRLTSLPLTDTSKSEASDSPAQHRGGVGDAGTQGAPSGTSSGVMYRSTSLALHRLEGESAHRYDWSVGVLISELCEKDALHAMPRQLSCQPAIGDGAPLRLTLGVSRSGPEGTVCKLILEPVFTLHNALPVPVDAILTPRWSRHVRVHLSPNQRLPLLHVDVVQLESISLCADGYESTPPLAPPPIADKLVTERRLRNHEELTQEPLRTADTSEHEDHVWAAPDTITQLRELGPGRSSIEVALRHGVAIGTGSHLLRFTCGMWVYNWIGLPISLREGSMVVAPLPAIDVDGMPTVVVDDDVPDSWVPPLAVPGQILGPGGGVAHSIVAMTPRSAVPTPRRPDSARSAPPAEGEGLVAAMSLPPLPFARGGTSNQSVSLTSRSLAAPSTARGAAALAPAAAFNLAGSSAAASVLSVGRAASTADVAGLTDILESSSAAELPSSAPNSARRSVLGMQRTVSRARGIADSMESTPTFELPSAWPSMASISTTSTGASGYGGATFGRLRLQVRATQTKAPPGRTFWTQVLELDPAGGVVIADLPLPSSQVSASGRQAQIAQQRGIYPVVITASPVPSAAGALALSIAPRYVLHNLLDLPIQYRQQGVGSGEKELEAGNACAVRWMDYSMPSRLCVRVQEAGWLWSGGFSLDREGDFFVKIRHRDRGETMLVRVDVATAAIGVMHVTLSHNSEGFAPYRVENCTIETLHCRQYGVREQQDVLRPYCQLLYAWDEPTLPHMLVLELPGGRTLGRFDLDKVGQDAFVSLPTSRRGDGEPFRLRVFVRAEGPTRVLVVLDEQRHLKPHDVAMTATEKSKDKSAIMRYASPGEMIWEISLNCVSLGASLVGPRQEVAYSRLTGVKVDVALGTAGFAASLQVRGLQVDNPSPWVAFPVSLVLPAPVSRLSSSMAAAVELVQAQALTARLAVWRRQRSGVICVEAAEINLPSMGVYIDQEHATELMAAMNGMFSASRNTALPPAPTCGGNDGGVGGHDDDGHEHPLRFPYDPQSTEAAGQQQQLLAVAATSGDTSPLLLGTPSHQRQPRPGNEGPGLERPLVPLASAFWEPPPRHRKVYMDSLSLSPIEVTLSFLSSPHPLGGASTRGHPRFAAIQRLLSLADVEDARLGLAGLRLANPLMDSAALGQTIQRHYLRALVPELFKIVGAASMFGDPAALLHHLGLGVWAFVSAPAAGLVESARQRGPQQFLLGVLSGTRGLLQNVVFAVSNAATKASGAARKAIVVWGLDRPEEPLGSGSFRRRVVWAEGDGASVFGGISHEQQGGVLAAALRGLVGLVSDPIRGVERGGFPGLLQGLQRGALGTVALPLAAFLEMSARTADSIRRAVAGSSNLGWLRPPRHVSPAEALERYDWSEAMGRWLLKELQRGEQIVMRRRQRRQYISDGVVGAASAVSSSFGVSGGEMLVGKREEFVLCVPVHQTNHYLVVTTRRTLYVRAKGLMWEPVVLWQADVGDVELATVCQLNDEGRKQALEGGGEEKPEENETQYKLAGCAAAVAVRFVALPPPQKLHAERRRSETPSSSGAEGGSPLAPRPFSCLRIEFDKMEVASRAVDAVHALMKTTLPQGQIVGWFDSQRDYLMD